MPSKLKIPPSGGADGLTTPPEKSNLPPIFIGDQVLDLPEPDWLLSDFIQETGLTVIYGPPGGGKSLVMQAWANVLSASGSNWKWMGRDRAKQANVLYVMGEGQGGLRGRLLAWMSYRAMNHLPPVHWIMEPVALWRPPGTQITEQQQALVDYIETESIDAVFIDTLAATYGGGNENQQHDMNMYLELLREFQSLGAAVVVAHHNAKNSTDLRGSTVLKGAADTVIQVRPDFSTETGRLVTTQLRSRKQKDGIPFLPIKMRPLHFEVDTKVGQSVVLDWNKEDESAVDTVDYHARVLDTIATNPGAVWTKIRDLATGDRKKLALARDDLLAEGDIEESGGGWFLASDSNLEIL